MENLKKALEKIFNVVMTLDQALEDKKIKGVEWVKIAGSGIALTWIFRNWEDVLAEFKALTDEQKKELDVWVSETFDIRNDVVENVVEQALMWLLALNNLTELLDVVKKPA